MKKFFDWDNLKTVKLSDKKSNIFRLMIPNGFNSFSARSYCALVSNAIKNEINTYFNDLSNVYLICVVDEPVDRKDLELIYDIVASCFTKHMTSDSPREDREHILGDYVCGNSVNLGLVNMKKWLNNKLKCPLVGLEVVKAGGFWKKRMVK